jgi:hypothetical protein
LSTQLHLGLPSGLFPCGFPTNILYAFLFPPLHSCYMPCPSHPPRLDHSNYIWQIVQIIKLLITQFIPNIKCIFLTFKLRVPIKNLLSTSMHL